MIYILYCSNSFDANELAGPWRGHMDDMRAIPLPCSGRLDILYLTKAFETGADGVVAVVCPEGECRYLEGNLRARKRVEAVEILLEESGLGKGRVHIIQLGPGGMERVVREIAEFRNRIEALTRPHLQTAAVSARERK